MNLSLYLALPSDMTFQEFVALDEGNVKSHKTMRLKESFYFEPHHIFPSRNDWNKTS